MTTTTVVSQPQKSSAYAIGVFSSYSVSRHTRRRGHGAGVEILARAGNPSSIVDVGRWEGVPSTLASPFHSILPLAIRAFLLPRVGGATAVFVVGIRTIPECSPPSSFQNEHRDSRGGQGGQGNHMCYRVSQLFIRNHEDASLDVVMNKFSLLQPPIRAGV